ncbi:MAG TPA: 16S rRNA (cytidine(1402)-2'-O)-methyltransferase [Gammaproteobacteria bacterium]|nr:16S rRNA (cytidine(1402)-2'-O)-methyltransferase [Gammaproteobacteria bacterium]
MSRQPGVLYVVATPIGNLADISARAREVLASVHVVAAEDTRHSGALLAHLGVKTPLISLHDHNEAERAPALVARLQAGDSVALISDAGTPLISDPGFDLVRASRAAGITVTPVPGASALVAALSVSGVPTDRFVFEGFLPAKQSARRERLTELAAETRTLVFYESVHRLKESLADMAAVFGAGRRAVLARELTKLHESVRDATLEELVDWAGSDPAAAKGEVVLIVAGAEAAEAGTRDVEAERVLKLLLAELPVKQAAVLAADITGLKKNTLYEKALALAGKKPG